VEEAQLRDLRALGLDWDGPVVRQSERMELYEGAIASLDAGGLLYPC
jgi:glutamyl-tRNA synthetase